MNLIILLIERQCKDMISYKQYQDTTKDLSYKEFTERVDIDQLGKDIKANSEGVVIRMIAKDKNLRRYRVS